jgi:ectoine hydroxylase-related dioxygenase (phytanoyl-CoA dioxygenase family)
MRRTLLDDAGETHLEEFGFAVVDFLTPELIAELERLHAQVGDAPDDPRRALYFGFHSESLAYKREMHHQILEVLREPAGVLFDRHEIYLATFIVKWPGPDSGFGPHQDPTLVDERFYRGVTLWAPLLPTGRDDRGNDNGMLHVVAGSHRFRQYARVRDVNQSIYADLEDEILGGCGAGVPTALGEAIVFDDQLIHYSVANATDEPRVVVSIGLRPRESRCVLVRPTRSAGLDLFEVPDASFIEVTSSAQDLWRPEDAPIAHLAPAPPTMSPAEFTRLCSAVRRSPRTVTPTPVRSDGGGRTVDPDAFCAFCGTNLGTLHRGARGKAQMECERCASERAASVRFQLPEEGFCLGTPIASAALAEIEQLFEPFAESANQPFWSSNVHATRADAVHINESLCRIVGSQLASDLRGYQPFLGAFITKAAGEHLVDLHQDWTYTDERSDRCVLAWIPLGDVDASLGALHAIPRSHRWTDGIRPGDVESASAHGPAAGAARTARAHHRCSRWPTGAIRPGPVARFGAEPRRPAAGRGRRGVRADRSATRALSASSGPRRRPEPPGLPHFGLLFHGPGVPLSTPRARRYRAMDRRGGPDRFRRRAHPRHGSPCRRPRRRRRQR